MSDELSRLAQLRAAVATHNEAYFTHDSPTIPDADYDEMVLELRGLETRYGVSDDALTTTVHPASSAGASFHMARCIGTFHGIIAPMTPTGSPTIMPKP